MLVRPVTVATALLATFCVLPGVASAAAPIAQNDAVDALPGETIVDVQSGVATSEGTDALVGMENVTGSRLADRLRGSTAAKELSGGAGVDVLLGRAGNDRLVGGAARNDLDGGPGRDVCLGANGGVRTSCEA